MVTSSMNVRIVRKFQACAKLLFVSHVKFPVMILLLVPLLILLIGHCMEDVMILNNHANDKYSLQSVQVGILSLHDTISLSDTMSASAHVRYSSQQMV